MNQSIVITAGGTGGHIFPALALAEYARSAHYQPHWLGTPEGMEAKLVPNADIPFVGIQIQGLRGKSWSRRLLAPWHIVRAFLQARRALKRLNPALVVAFGGYVTGPVGLAAYTLKIPLVLHEQNAYMGLTNRCLQYIARRVCLAFPLSHSKETAVIVGNPVRPGLLTLSPKVMVPVSRPLHILVLGGSQGALAINHLLPSAIALLSPEKRPLIWHQAGKDKVDDTVALYHKHGISATVKAFIDDMAEAYAWADCVIARSGAMTVSEIAVVGVPAIFIPYPHAVDDHQTANATYLSDAGAAYLLPQAKATAEACADILSCLNDDRTSLVNMAKKANMLAKPEATKQLWQVCLGVLCENTSTNSVTEP